MVDRNHDQAYGNVKPPPPPPSIITTSTIPTLMPYEIMSLPSANRIHPTSISFAGTTPIFTFDTATDSNGARSRVVSTTQLTASSLFSVSVIPTSSIGNNVGGERVGGSGLPSSSSGLGASDSSSLSGGGRGNGEINSQASTSVIPIPASSATTNSNATTLALAIAIPLTCIAVVAGAVVFWMMNRRTTKGEGGAAGGGFAIASAMEGGRGVGIKSMASMGALGAGAGAGAVNSAGVGASIDSSVAALSIGTAAVVLNSSATDTTNVTPTEPEHITFGRNDAELDAALAPFVAGTANETAAGALTGVAGVAAAAAALGAGAATRSRSESRSNTTSASHSPPAPMNNASDTSDHGLKAMGAGFGSSSSALNGNAVTAGVITSTVAAGAVVGITALSKNSSTSFPSEQMNTTSDDASIDVPPTAPISTNLQTDSTVVSVDSVAAAAALSIPSSSLSSSRSRSNSLSSFSSSFGREKSSDPDRDVSNFVNLYQGGDTEAEAEVVDVVASLSDVKSATSPSRLPSSTSLISSSAIITTPPNNLNPSPPKPQPPSTAQIDVPELTAYVPPPPHTHVVIRSYHSHRADELHLEVGDIIALECTFPDGWARGQNASKSHKRGLLPLCVLKLQKSGPSQQVAQQGENGEKYFLVRQRKRNSTGSTTSESSASSDEGGWLMSVPKRVESLPKETVERKSEDSRHDVAGLKAKWERKG